jgi:hypothetical protein
MNEEEDNYGEEPLQKKPQLFYRVKKSKSKCCDSIIDGIIGCFFGCMCCCFESVD